MKKALKITLTLAFSFLLAVTLFAGNGIVTEDKAYAAVVDYSALPAVAPDGNGTSATPYLITSVANIKWISDQVYSGENFAGNYFEQTSDIDFSEVINFYAIGLNSSTGDSKSFSGTYDGNGYIINGYTLTTGSVSISGAGFFYSLSGANISYINFVNSSVSGYLYVATGDYYTSDIGILAATVTASTISHITLDGGFAKGAYSVGGLAGTVADSSVSYIRSSADVYSKNTTNKSITGGLVGNWAISGSNINSSLTYSYSIGDITIGNASNDSGRFGGLIGNVAQDADEDDTLTLTNCYFSGSITDSTNPSVAIGALLGVDATDSKNLYNVILTSNLYNIEFIGVTTLRKPFPGYDEQTTASQVKGLSSVNMKSAAALLAYGWDVRNIWVVDTSKADSAEACFGQFPDYKSLYTTTRFIVEKSDSSAVTVADTNFFSEVAVVSGNQITVEFKPSLGQKVSVLILDGVNIIDQLEDNKVTFTVPALAPTSTYDLQFSFATATYALSINNLGYIGDSAAVYGLGGRVTLNVADRENIAYGTVVEFTIIANENFKFNGVIDALDSNGNAVTVTTIESGVKYSIVMRDDISLDVSWSKLEVKLTSRLNLSGSGYLQIYAGTYTDGIAEDGFENITSSSYIYNFYSGDTVSIRTMAVDDYRFKYFKARINKSAGYMEYASAVSYIGEDGWKYWQITFTEDINYFDIEVTMMQVISVGIYVDPAETGIARVVLPHISTAPLPASASGVISDYTVPYGTTIAYYVYYLDDNGGYVFVGDEDIESETPGSYVAYDSNNPAHNGLQRYSTSSSSYNLSIYNISGVKISTIKIKTEGSEVYFDFEAVKYSLQLIAYGGTDAVVFKYTTTVDGSVDVDDFISAENNLISVTYGTAVKISVEPKGSRFAGWTLNDANGNAFDMGAYETFVNDLGATVFVFDYVINENITVHANTVNLWTVAVVNPTDAACGYGGIITVNGVAVNGMPVNYEVETGTNIQILIEVNNHYTLNTDNITYTSYTFYKENAKTYYTFTIDNIKAYTAVSVVLTQTTYTPTIFVADEAYGKVITSGIGASLTYGAQFKVKAESNYGYRFIHWLINEGKGNAETTNENIEYTHTVTGNDSIEAIFEVIDTGSVIYTVTVTAGDGIKSVARGGEFYYANESVTIQALVEEGYVFEGWYVNGVLFAGSNDARFNFNVTGNITLEARANPQTFEVISIAGSGYTITKSSTKSEYSVGEIITFNCILSSGYEFVEWLVNGAKVGNTSTTLRLTITEKVTVSAVVNSIAGFSEQIPNNKYNITFICDETQGSVSYGSNSVLPGESVSISATPKPNYVFKYWLVNGSIVSSETKMILRSIEEDYTVTAVFEAAPRSITYSTGEGGSVISGDTVALNGSTSSISIEADYGYRIASITVGDEVINVNNKNYIYDLVVDGDKEVIIQFQKVFLSSVEMGIIVASAVLIFAFVLVLLLVMKRKPKASFEQLIAGLKVNKAITIAKTVEVPQTESVTAENALVNEPANTSVNDFSLNDSAETVSFDEVPSDSIEGVLEEESFEILPQKDDDDDKK